MAYDFSKITYDQLMELARKSNKNFGDYTDLAAFGDYNGNRKIAPGKMPTNRYKTDLSSLGLGNATFLANDGSGNWGLGPAPGDDHPVRLTRGPNGEIVPELLQANQGWLDEHMDELAWAALAAVTAGGAASALGGGGAAAGGGGLGGGTSIAAMTPEAAWTGGLDAANTAVAGMGGATGIGSAGGALGVAEGGVGAGGDSLAQYLNDYPTTGYEAPPDVAVPDTGYPAPGGVPNNPGLPSGVTNGLPGVGLGSGLSTGSTTLDGVIKDQVIKGGIGAVVGGATGGTKTGTSGGTDWGKLLGGFYDVYANKQAANQIKPALDKLNNMYAVGSPEANQMQKELDARDAAAGRRSQYGTRAVELRAKLADSQAKLLSSPGYLGLNQAYAQNSTGGIAGLLGGLNKGGTNSLINTGVNSLTSYLTKLFNGGDSGGNTGGYTSTPDVSVPDNGYPAPDSPPSDPGIPWDISDLFGASSLATAFNKVTPASTPSVPNTNLASSPFGNINPASQLRMDGLGGGGGYGGVRTAAGQTAPALKNLFDPTKPESFQNDPLTNQSRNYLEATNHASIVPYNMYNDYQNFWKTAPIGGAGVDFAGGKLVRSNTNGASEGEQVGIWTGADGRQQSLTANSNLSSIARDNPSIADAWRKQYGFNANPNNPSGM